MQQHPGKTHLAIGLGIRACQAGHRVLFATAVQWVARLADAHTHGTLQAELGRLGRYPLLVIDEVGYIPFEPEAANLFFQLVSARYERASLIVTSNKPFGKAHRFPATYARWDRAFTGSGGRAAVPAVAIIGRAACRSRRQLRSVGPDRVAVARWCWLVTVRARRRSGGSPWGWDPRGPGQG